MKNFASFKMVVVQKAEEGCYGAARYIGQEDSPGKESFGQNAPEN